MHTAAQLTWHGPRATTWQTLNTICQTEYKHLLRSAGLPLRNMLSLGAWRMGLGCSGKTIRRRPRRRRPFLNMCFTYAGVDRLCWSFRFYLCWSCSPMLEFVCAYACAFCSCRRFDLSSHVCLCWSFVCLCFSCSSKTKSDIVSLYFIVTNKVHRTDGELPGTPCGAERRCGHLCLFTTIARIWKYSRTWYNTLEQSWQYWMTFWSHKQP